TVLLKHVFSCNPLVLEVEQRRRQVAFTIRRNDRNNALALAELLGYLQCCEDRCAGGDAAEDALFLRRAASRLERFVVLDRQYAVIDLTVQDVRHEVRADALNLMRARLAAR